MKFRSIVALALMFWCAGTGCMIVSYARAAAISEASQGAAARATTSLAAHACCKARHKAKKRKAGVDSSSESRSAQAGLMYVRLRTPVPANSMSCCPLTTGAIVAGLRVRSTDDASAFSHASSILFASTDSNPAPHVIPLRLPNRARSYLLDCAFLI